MRSFIRLDSEQLKILNKMLFPEMYDPFPMKILWLKAGTPHSKAEECGQIPHHHKFFEIHFYLEGEAKYLINKQDISVISENQFIIFPPNTIHEKIESDEDALRFSLAYEISAHTDEQKSMADYLISHHPFVGLIAPDMREVFTSIAAELDYHSPLTPVILRNFIYNLIYRVCRQESPFAIRRTPSEQPKSMDQRVRSAMRFINDNLDMPLTAKSIADYTHISYKQLNRLFLCEWNTTVLRYIHDQKNEKAKKLLSESTLSLSEIGQAVGFESEYYFNAFFKKINGISPGAFRKECQSYSKKLEY